MKAALAGSLLAALASVARVASAEPTRKIHVDTEPVGATIYVGDVDAGVACTPSPCDVTVPAGKATPIIARKDGYQPEIATVDLRKKAVKSIKLELQVSGGELLFDDPGLAGGAIEIDDVDRGVAPQHIAAEALPHHVKVTVKGRVVFDDLVKLGLGEEHAIAPTAAPPATGLQGDAAIAAAGDAGEPSDKVTKQVAIDDGPRETWFTLGADFDVGFRQFKYDDAKNLPPTEDEGGQVLLGPVLQIWPMRLFGLHHLRGLSLYAKVGFGVNHKQVVQAPDNMPTGTETYWGNIEIDLLHRWNIGDTAAVEIGGGFVRDQLEYQTTTDTSTALSIVPYADYRSLRLGARGILRLGAVEPFVQAEGRIVLSEGELASRFASADVTGAAGAAGVNALVGPLALRVQGSIVYYGWTLTNASGATVTAEGARDVVEVISMVVSYAY